MALDIQLKPWQKIVYDLVEQHEELVNGESMISLNTFEVNQQSRISVALPRAMGHSTLAAYIALHMPTALIYRNLADLNNILDTCNATTDDLKKSGTETISWYELTYYISLATPTTSAERDVEFQAIKKKIENKKAVVVDNGAKVQRNLPQLVDFFLVISKGAVVLLG